MKISVNIGRYYPTRNYNGQLTSTTDVSSTTGASQEQLPAAMAPWRADGLYVAVVGGGVQVPFLRGGGNPAIPLSDSVPTEGYRKVGLHRGVDYCGSAPVRIFDTWAKRAVREYWVSTL